MKNKHTDLYRFNSLHKIFEVQAERYPARTALIHEDASVTYSQLNRNANQLSYILKEKMPEGNQLVGIYMEKGISAIIAMLAILKSGHAYVPIEVSYPKERIEYIIENSGIEYIISETAFMSELEAKGRKLIDINEPMDTSEETPDWHDNSERLAYVIYTSGTTGKPKGVMITHRNIVGLMRSTEGLFDFRSTDIWSIFHSFCFDFSVWEIYGPLLYGGCGVIISTKLTKDPIATVEILKKHKVTVLNQVPSSFYILDEADSVTDGTLETLRYLIFGGEGLKPKKLKAFHSRYASVQLINMYGITEITVHGTFKHINKQDILSNDSNIGVPLPGLEMELLDLENHLPVKDGEVGEIVVSGYGVARGYMNNPSLTDEKFMTLDRHAGRNYFSGDLGRRNEQGEIIYAGRCDNQVKIRGFRVELSEIESALMKVKGIENAVVLMSQDAEGNDELFAFLTNTRDFTATEVRRTLSGNLPDYMMPYYFISVDQVPLTSNGKCDRSALLARKNQTIPLGTDQIRLPRTELEIRVTSYLSELLHKEIKNMMDNFFELGGDSLKAAKLINTLKEWGYQLSFNDLFDSETLDEIIRRTKGVNGTEIEEAQSTQQMKASLVERRMFAVSESCDSKAYNITIPISLEGELEGGRLEAALNKALMNHEIFKCRYAMNDIELIKITVPLSSVKLAAKEVSNHDFLMNYDSYVKTFAPTDYPLYEIQLFRHTEKTHTLLFNCHHMIFDGISLEVLLDEVFEFYKDQNHSLKPETSYNAYVEYETAYLKSEQFIKNRSYWLNNIHMSETRNELARDYPRPQNRQLRGKTLYYSMNHELISQMKSICHNFRISPFMFSQGIFHILLSKLVETDEILTGTITSGRPDTSFEKTVGMFVNTLLFFSKPARDKSLKSYFGEIRNTSFGLFENQLYPFDKIIEDFNIPYTPDRNPIFDYMFVYQNFRENKTVSLGQHLTAVFDKVRQESDFSKFDMTLELVEYPNELLLRLNYNTAIFKNEKMTSFMKMYENTFKSVIENIHSDIKHVEILTPVEKRQLLVDFNRSFKEIQQDSRGLSQYVSDKLKGMPDHAAIVAAGERLTFREADEISSYYAQMIREMGIDKNDIVGICMKRSIYLYAAMLAVVRAGAGFLVIDTSLPEERIQYMLEDSGCALIIGQFSFQARTDKPFLQFPEKKEALRRGETNISLADEGEDLSYVIYTSGTTGRPKGVKLKRKSTVNMCDFLYQSFNEQHGAHLTVASVTFDMFVIDFFSSLAMKSTLVLPTEEERIDNDLIAELMEQENVGTVIITPTRLDSLLETHPERVKRLKAILCGGETLKPATASKVLEQTNAALFNFYGPSETTVYCTGKQILDPNDVTIGKPAAFSNIYITDRYGNLMPIGYEGEIWVGGQSVGKGYINRDALNEEKFIPDPFNQGMVYKTGDHGIYREDGEIIFKGRRDQQVKLHGFRIELDEITNAVLEIEQVASAEVYLGKDRQNELELRGVITGNVKLEAVESKLRQILPYYMIPKLIQVEEIPMTLSGKIDTEALNEAFNNRQDEKKHHDIQPETEMERKLLEGYRKILNRADLGVTDHFFFSGGDSIKAIQLASYLRKEGIAVTVTLIMNNPDVRTLSKQLKFEALEMTAVERVETGMVPLLPIHRFYFERNGLNDHNFNQSMIVECVSGLQLESAEKAIEKLIAHHGALRTRYSMVDGAVLAECMPFTKTNVKIDTYQCENSEIETMLEKVDEWNQGKISLVEGELINASLLKTQRKDYLIFTIHHMAVDGVSFRIFLRDFAEQYTAEQKGESVELSVSDTMLMWGKHWAELDCEKRFEKEIQYWKAQQNKLHDTIQPFEQPKSFSTKEESLTFSEAVTEKLISGLHEKFGTNTQMLLVTAFAETFKDDSSGAFMMLMEGHGREIEHTGLDVSNTMGWFTTLYPLVFSNIAGRDLGHVIREVKDSITSIPEHGISYGVLKYYAPEHVKRELDRLHTEAPSYMLNYMGEMGMEQEGDFKVVDKAEKFDVSDLVDIGIGLTYNITIINGKMKVSAIYNDSLLSQAEVAEGLKRYEEKLTDILNYIETLDEERVVSAGDFEESDLSNDELDELLEYLEVM